MSHASAPDSSPPRRPLLFVDVDGVISLFGFDPATRPEGRWLLVDGIAHLLSAQAAEHLAALGVVFDLVWCTGWEEKANDYLPSALGLPGPLPHLRFARGPGRRHAHWKLDAIEAHAGARPLAWVDDAHDGDCAAWAAARGVPTLLVPTDPARGLGAAEAARLLDWAGRLAGDASGSGARGGRAPR